MINQKDIPQMKDRDCYSYEMGPFRPPSEGRSHSLLIRASRGCSWNRCTFCITNDRNRPKFQLRTPEEIIRDIDTIRVLVDEIEAASRHLGYNGSVNNEVINTLIQNNTNIYSSKSVDISELQQRFQCLINVANWLNSGCKTVFLQDSNSLILRTRDLITILNYLKKNFPTIERVTTNGRAKTCYKKSLDELIELREAGLSRIHVGFETGCDEVLQFIDKGVTAREEIEGGKRVIEAGISLSEYFMPGLGGKKWSQKHALDSAQVLNEINPDFIRIRTLALRQDSPLYTDFKVMGYDILSESQMVDELGLLLENLTCNSYITSDHIWNLLMEVEGQLPDAKEEMLGIIRTYQLKPLLEKLTLNLNRRLRYFSLTGIPHTRQLVEEAQEAIRTESSDAETKVEKAIFALKQHGG